MPRVTINIPSNLLALMHQTFNVKEVRDISTKEELILAYIDSTLPNKVAKKKSYLAIDVLP